MDLPEAPVPRCVVDQGERIAYLCQGVRDRVVDVEERVAIGARVVTDRRENSTVLEHDALTPLRPEFGLVARTGVHRCAHTGAV